MLYNISMIADKYQWLCFVLDGVKKYVEKVNEKLSHKIIKVILLSFQFEYI